MTDKLIQCLDGDEIAVSLHDNSQGTLEVWNKEDNVTVTVYLTADQRIALAHALTPEAFTALEVMRP